MLGKLNKTPIETGIAILGILSIALLLLLFAWPSQASEAEPALEDLFAAVNGSVVLLRTRERALYG